MRSHRSSADGVVGIEEVFRNAFLRRGSILDHPVRSVIRRLRDFFLMSRPPLLCQEGSGTPNSFTPSLTRLPTFLPPTCFSTCPRNSCAAFPPSAAQYKRCTVDRGFGRRNPDGSPRRDRTRAGAREPSQSGP